MLVKYRFLMGIKIISSAELFFFSQWYSIDRSAGLDKKKIKKKL